jgi:hypothetical protein
VDANADHVASLNRLRIQRFNRFVDQERIAPFGAGRGGEDVQPARSDHGDAKRLATRIDEMNPHALDAS